MRTYVRRGRASGTTELRIVSSRGEAINLVQARALAEAGEGALLPCAYDVARGGGRVTLRYDLTGFDRLARRLRRHRLDRAGLRVMLQDLADAMAWCLRSVPGEPLVLYQADWVFVRADGHLGFVMVPLDGVSARPAASPLCLMRRLADEMGRRHASAQDLASANRLAEFIEGERHSFSLNRLRTFLAEEFSVLPSSERIVPHALSARLRVTNTAESYRLVEGRVYELGRAPSCDVCLASWPQVSRCHATLRCDQDGATVTDQGSTNGTWLSRCRLAPFEDTRISYGQVFALSDCSLLLEKG